MIKIQRADTTIIGQFGLELKKLMMKYDIQSMTPAFDDMEISIGDKKEMKIVGVNFQTGIGQKKKNNLIEFRR